MIWTPMNIRNLLEVEDEILGNVYFQQFFYYSTKAIDLSGIQKHLNFSLALFEMKLTKDFEHIAINNIKVNLNLNWSKMINKSFEQCWGTVTVITVHLTVRVLHEVMID